MDDIKIGSNRSFGIVFFIVFLFIAFYPLFNNEGLRIWSLIIAIIFLILGLISLKANDKSPWIWQQLNSFFKFMIDTVLIPFLKFVKFAGWELFIAVVNLIAVIVILFRIKQFKSEIDDLAESEEILQGHIEWLDDNMAEIDDK